MQSARPSFICASCARALRSSTSSSAAPFSRSLATTAARQDSLAAVEHHDDLPRWRKTPRQMKMPIRVRPQPNQPVWQVNDRVEVIDEAFDKFVGRVGGNVKGSQMLDEETKWTAMTHKSFDHGRQGFNDRLAYLGKRIVDWQTSLALLNAPTNKQLNLPSEDVYKHPALDGLENVTAASKQEILDKGRLARLAMSYGIDKAIRWKPRKADNLRTSGLDAVLAHSIYSMVGALAMRQGGDIAAKTVREKILQPLGLR